MPKIKCTYQGIPCIDGDFSLRVGVEPSTGWIRFISTPGEFVHPSLDMDLVKQFFRSGGAGGGDAKKHVAAAWEAARDRSPSRGPGKTTTRPRGEPTGKNQLKHPWGSLVLETEAGDGHEATKTVLHNIFWIDATVDEYGKPSKEDGIPDGYIVVKVILADERILWGMGGYVALNRNVTLNETGMREYGESTAGDFIVWSAEMNRPNRAKRLSRDDTREGGRPILDPKSLIGGAEAMFKDERGGASNPRMHTAADLITECFARLPGAPRLDSAAGVAAADGYMTEDAKTATQFNVMWGRGVLSKTALNDTLQKHNLILVPEYGGLYGGGTFSVYKKAEPRDSKSVDAGMRIVNKPGSISSKLASFRNGKIQSLEMDMRPMAVEVIGDRVHEEIMCPSWRMVIKNDGVDAGGRAETDPLLQGEGRWVDAEQYLAKLNTTIDQCGQSLMANWDKRNSGAFDFIPPAGAGPARSLREKRKSLLRSHLFRSFMVSGPFRQYLPMLKGRAVPLSHALNLPDVEPAPQLSIMSDGWTPSKARELGDNFLLKIPLMPVSLSDLSHIDYENGVITFKEPMGTPIYVFAIPPGLEGTVFDTLRREWKDERISLEGKMQQIIDGVIYAKTSGGKERTFDDVTATIRKYMTDFMREILAKQINEELDLAWEPLMQTWQGYYNLFKMAHGIYVNSATIKEAETAFAYGELDKIAAQLKEMMRTTRFEGMSITQEGVTQAGELFNISEFMLIPPRIVGIWAWARNYGREDDWYRFRYGDDPGAIAFPLRKDRMRQFVSLDGSTNKGALDLQSAMIVGSYLEGNRKPLRGEVNEWAGFHPVGLSGSVHDVNFRFSLQGADAVTTVNSNRFAVPIEGKQPAVSTWSIFNSRFVKLVQGSVQ